MSAESSLLTIDTAALHRTVAELCAGHERLEEFLRGMFGDLGCLADEMARQCSWIDSARSEQTARQSEQSDRLQHDHHSLESAFERIQELTSRLETSAVASSGGTEHFQKLLENMEAERAAFRASLETSESQSQERLARQREELETVFNRIEKLTERLGETPSGAAGGYEPLQAMLTGLQEEREAWRAQQSAGSNSADLVRMADDLAVARQELAEAREELKSQRELLSRVSVAQTSAGDSDLRSRLDRIEEERLAWAQERATLETELDAVRNRAAELADTLDNQRQQASGERKDWAEELRQMRQLLESLGQRGAIALPGAAAPAAAASEPAEAEDSQDPVLDSVMAQFEILQKDLARRRKAKPAAK